MKMTIVSAVAFSAIAAGAAPQVSQVNFTQDQSRKVKITYALSGEPGIVTFDIRTNGVSIGAANITHAWGDVNKLVGVSNDRTIWWAADKSWPGHNITDGSVTAVVTAWATNAPPNYLVIGLTEPYPANYYETAEQVPDGVTNEVYKTTKLVMRKIPAKGVVWRMGSPSTEPQRGGNETAHMVTLGDDYYMGVYPVTQKQYATVMSGKNPSKRVGDLQPVENFLWGDDLMGYHAAGKPDDMAFDDWSFIGTLRSKLNFVFNLPTEAQWEFACRAGCGAGLYTGKEVTTSDKAFCPNVDEVAWFGDENTGAQGNTTAPQPVGLKLPNDWGLYDMLGNVNEYCLDWYGDYPTVPAGESLLDPKGPDSGERRIVRGGDFWYRASHCRCAYRQSQKPGARGDSVGVRVMCPTGTR